MFRFWATLWSRGVGVAERESFMRVGVPSRLVEDNEFLSFSPMIEVSSLLERVSFGGE